MAAGPLYIASARTAQKTQFPTVTPLLHIKQPLPSNGCFSVSTVHPLSIYGTIFYILKLIQLLISLTVSQSKLASDEMSFRGVAGSSSVTVMLRMPSFGLS
jgi:hypothetical protein